MKTAIILETDHLSLPVSDLLNPKELKLVGIGNACPETWNVFEDPDTGKLKEEIEGLPVMPIDLAVSLQPDLCIIVATDPEKSHALQYMAIRAGFENDIRFIGTMAEEFSVTGAVLRRLTRRLETLAITGSVAELGCGKGDLSWQLNALMPGRQLYLDACLYQPTYAGLEFFFPRMSQGGILLVKGYESTRYGGIHRAVEDLETRYGAFLILPLGDLEGSVMIVHP